MMENINKLYTHAVVYSYRSLSTIKSELNCVNEKETTHKHTNDGENQNCQQGKHIISNTEAKPTEMGF